MILDEIAVSVGALFMPRLLHAGSGELQDKHAAMIHLRRTREEEGRRLQLHVDVISAQHGSILEGR